MNYIVGIVIQLAGCNLSMPAPVVAILSRDCDIIIPGRNAIVCIFGLYGAPPTAKEYFWYTFSNCSTAWRKFNIAGAINCHRIDWSYRKTVPYRRLVYYLPSAPGKAAIATLQSGKLFGLVLSRVVQTVEFHCCVRIIFVETVSLCACSA